MRAWFSAAELAALNLPGLPGTKRSINRLAERDEYARRRRKGNGGGWEYSIESLPAAAQAAIIARQAPANEPGPAVEPETQQLWAEFESLPESLQGRARERAAAMRAVQALLERGCPAIEAYKTVAEDTGNSLATVRRLWSQVKAARVDAWPAILAPQYRGRQPKQDYDQQAFEAFKADFLRPSQPAAKACYRRLERIAADQGWTIPTLGVLLRRLDREIPAPAQALAREGRQALKDSYPAQERDRSVFHALEAVSADGHKCNTFVRWPDGTISRPILLAWHDLYSGKILAWRLAQSEDSNTVRLSFGDLIEAWGLPEHVYVDNGRAFASKQISGGAKTRYRFKIKPDDPGGLLVELGIEPHWAEPGAGQSKPIERWFGEYDEYVGKHPGCQGAYTGKNTNAKPEDYASRAIPVAEYERIAETEITAMNARNGRRSRVCDGRSFDETFLQSYAEFPVRKASAAQRRLFLLQAEGVRTDRKTGAVTLAGNRYWSEQLSAMPATRVVLRFDPERLHAPVYVYGLDGRFLCQADVIEAAGFNDMAAAQAHARDRNRFKRAQKQMLDAERRLTASDVARLMPENDPAPKTDPKVVRPLFEAPRRDPAFDQDETNEIFGRAVRSMTGAD